MTAIVDENPIDEIVATLEDVVRLLVDYPDDVAISVVGTTETSIFSIKVNPADLGKVIGKGGSIAESLRTLVISACGRLKLRAMLEILDSKKTEKVAG